MEKESRLQLLLWPEGLTESFPVTRSLCMCVRAPLSRIQRWEVTPQAEIISSDKVLTGLTEQKGERWDVPTRVGVLTRCGGWGQQEGLPTASSLHLLRTQNSPMTLNSDYTELLYVNT